MTLPTDAVPIIDWPEYSITPSGEVWRVVPNNCADGRRGPVPRVVNPVMMGGAAQTKKSPSVKLSRHGCFASRTIRFLVRQHFGE